MCGMHKTKRPGRAARRGQRRGGAREIQVGARVQLLSHFPRAAAAWRPRYGRGKVGTKQGPPVEGRSGLGGSKYLCSSGRGCWHSVRNYTFVLCAVCFSFCVPSVFLVFVPYAVCFSGLSCGPFCAFALRVCPWLRHDRYI